MTPTAVLSPRRHDAGARVRRMPPVPVMHFMEADLTEDWVAAIDWDTVVSWILVFGKLNG